MPLSAGLYYFGSGNENWSRPAVILIHGAGGNHLYWPPEIRRMPGQRVYALDLPGHGKSEGIGRQTIVDYATCVIEMMKDLKLRKAVFVGHSMGGAIALQLGLARPSLTLGLILIGTSSQLRVSPTLLEVAASPSTFQLAVQKVVDESFSQRTSQNLKDLARKRMLEGRSSVLYGDLLACDSYNVTDRLSRLKAPTLIVCGTEDRMTPIRYSLAMHEKIKNSMFRQMEGGGHMIMLEDPISMANIIQLFLSGIAYKPGVIE